MAEEISKPEQQIYDTAARELISYEDACRQEIDGMIAAGIPEDVIVPVYEKALRSIQEREAAPRVNSTRLLRPSRITTTGTTPLSLIPAPGRTCARSSLQRLARMARPLFTRNPVKLSVFLPTPRRRI